MTWGLPVSGFTGAIVIGIVLSALVAPTTAVRVVPSWQPLEETIEIRGEPTLLSPDPRRMMVPIRTAQVTVEGTQVVPTTGRKAFMNAKAEGWITLMNRTDKTVIVPRATVVSTLSGIRFETIEETRLPGYGSSAKVRIMAMEPGDRSSARRNEIVRVEGPLSLQVSALNEDEVKGGGVQESSVVTAADGIQAREMLLARLNDEALAQLRKDRGLKPGDEFLSDAVYAKVLKEQFDRREGDQARTLSLSVQAQVRGSAVNVGEVVALAERAWQPTLKPGFTLPASTIRMGYPTVRAVDPHNGALTMAVKASGTTVARIDREQVERSMRWMSEGEIITFLQEKLPLAEPPAVVMTPDWVGRALRVSIVVEEPGRKRE